MLYPPVWASFPAVPWAEKEDAFVMIGRIAPEKRIGRAVSIVSRLRQAGFPLKLRVCGPIGSDPYGRVVQRLCSQNADWLIPEGQVSGDRKARILASCKFGIQTCAAEAFGISVAEMARAGAIVFAPSDGGQAEILENPLLTFSSEDDAVEKIRAVLLDAALQTRLRAHLAARAEVFSIQSYVRDYRRLVATSLDRAFAAA
jgi:glycosyltransferase involved in cell wall biosynthesis